MHLDGHSWQNLTLTGVNVRFSVSRLVGDAHQSWLMKCPFSSWKGAGLGQRSQRSVITTGSVLFWGWNEHICMNAAAARKFSSAFYYPDSPSSWIWLCCMGTHLLVVTRLIIEGNLPTQLCQGHLFSNGAVGFWRMGLNCFFKIQKSLPSAGGYFWSAVFEKGGLLKCFPPKDVRGFVPSVCNNTYQSLMVQTVA